MRTGRARGSCKTSNLDEGYDGHNGPGYQVQISQAYDPGKVSAEMAWRECMNHWIASQEQNAAEYLLPDVNVEELAPLMNSGYPPSVGLLYF